MLNINAAPFTHSPTEETEIPAAAPTSSPTLQPTPLPSTPPTLSPTPSPTWRQVVGKMEREGYSDGGYFRPHTQYSTNIYPLSYRKIPVANATEEEPMTYETFSIPGDKPHNIFAILAWSEIDAELIIEGCSYDESDFLWNETSHRPSDFYFCEGTWRLIAVSTTFFSHSPFILFLWFAQTARLAYFQQTYGKFEVWSVDDDGSKWMEYDLEFQWNTSNCLWTTAWDPIECPLLPLTTNTQRTFVSNQKKSVLCPLARMRN